MSRALKAIQMRNYIKEVELLHVGEKDIQQILDAVAEGRIPEGKELNYLEFYNREREFEIERVA